MQIAESNGRKRRSRAVKDSAEHEVPYQLRKPDLSQTPTKMRKATDEANVVS